MDEELKALAVQALCNAFYEGFSSLVNEYLEASKGLADLQEVALRLGDLTSLYGRNTSARSDVFAPKILVRHRPKTGLEWPGGHYTLLGALLDSKAVAVFLDSQKVFERNENGEWYFVGS